MKHSLNEHLQIMLYSNKTFVNYIIHFVYTFISCNRWKLQMCNYVQINSVQFEAYFDRKPRLMEFCLSLWHLMHWSDKKCMTCNTSFKYEVIIDNFHVYLMNLIVSAALNLTVNNL